MVVKDASSLGHKTEFPFFGGERITSRGDPFVKIVEGFTG